MEVKTNLFVRLNNFLKFQGRGHFYFEFSANFLTFIFKLYKVRLKSKEKISTLKLQEVILQQLIKVGSNFHQNTACCRWDFHSSDPSDKNQLFSLDYAKFKRLWKRIDLYSLETVKSMAERGV